MADYPLKTNAGCEIKSQPADSCENPNCQFKIIELQTKVIELQMQITELQTKALDLELESENLKLQLKILEVRPSADQFDIMQELLFRDSRESLMDSAMKPAMISHQYEGLHYMKKSVEPILAENTKKFEEFEEVD